MIFQIKLNYKVKLVLSILLTLVVISILLTGILYLNRPIHQLELSFIQWVTQSKMFLIAIYSVIGITLSLAIGLIFYFLVTRPLKKITSVIAKTESGKYLAMPYLQSKDEIGQLVGKLNRLILMLADSQNTLNVLFHAIKILTSKLDIDEILTDVLEMVKNQFNLVSSSVILLAEDGWLRIKNQRGLSTQFVKAIKIKPGESFVSKSMNQMRTVIVNDSEQDPDPVLGDVLREEKINSYIHFPLIVSGKAIGVLNVNALEKGFFTDEKVRGLAALAEYLSIAIRNAQLYQRLQEFNRRLETEVKVVTKELTQTNMRLIQRVKQLHALYDLAITTSPTLNLEEMLTMVMKKTKELFDAERAGFFLYELSTNELVLQKGSFELPPQETDLFKIRVTDSGKISQIFQKSDSFFSNDIKKDEVDFSNLDKLFPVGSVLMIPLKLVNRTIGVFVILNKKTGPFTHEDIRVVSILTSRIAELIENIKLYQQIQQRLRDMSVLREISSAIVSKPVLEQTLGKITHIIAKAFSADYCCFLLHNEQNGELAVQLGYFASGEEEIESSRIKISDLNYLSVKVFNEGKMFFSNNALTDDKINKTYFRSDMKSVIILPLKVEEQTIGVLRIGALKVNAFNADSFRLGTMIADQVAVIVENARLYGRIQEANLELQRLNRVKNEFISIVSHELRTPLTALKGFVSVLVNEEAGKINEQQKKFLTIIDHSIERLSMLITDLLDISRIETGQLKIQTTPVSVLDLASRAIENIRTQFQDKKLELKMNVSSSLPEIQVDRYRISQVIDNLLVNAVKFTSTGGQITISAEEKGDFVQISVKDTGIGIPVREQNKIFEKFYQVDASSIRKFGGVGLGLAIVKSIIELHGGRIWVESEPGKGADFKFVLPRVKSPQRIVVG